MYVCVISTTEVNKEKKDNSKTNVNDTAKLSSDNVTSDRTIIKPTLSKPVS